MSVLPIEQRNPYKGTPARPWVRVRFTKRDGSHHEIQLMVDTGSPFVVILSHSLMRNLRNKIEHSKHSNFGVLEGGVLHLSMPELGVDQDVLGYGSDVVASYIQASSLDFDGLVGLPFLRLLEYGGDADEFWIRPLQQKP